MKNFLSALAVAAVVVLPAAVHAAPEPPAGDDLSSARDLYAEADYENALQLLNRLRVADHRPEDTRAIEQYRAFCLLALGRSTDAEQAIAAVVLAEPGYKPSSDLSPRVRTAFTDVRKRLLPGIVQEKYAAAKMAFDQKNFMAAATGFQQVLETMNDPDLGTAVNQPPLSDLKTLAMGFRDLAASAVPPPPPPPPPAPVAAAAPPVPVSPRIYSADDLFVIAPVAIQQTLPPFPASITIAGQGVLEVVIDETGAVEAAAMRVPVSPRYDRTAVDAARGWKFKPAMLNGQPVKYRKMVQITIKR
jgi:TonB family protein